MKKIDLFLLFIILFISFLLGSKMILHGDFFYLFDQSRDYMLVRDIVETHKITLIGTHSGLGGFFHGPIWLYLLIPFYLLGHGNPFIFTYAYLSIALLTVLAGFFIGKKLYDTSTGLLFAFFLAVSPSIWSYVPNTIGVNMLPLVFIFLLYFLILYFRGNAKAYIPALFLAGFALQFETAVSLALIPIVIVSFFLNKGAIRQAKVMLFSLIAFFVSLSTFIFFDIRHHFLMTHAISSLFTNSKHGKDYLPFPDRIINHLTSFQNVYESILIHKTFILELLLALLVLGFFYYQYKKKLALKKRAKEFWYLILFPIAFFIMYLGYSEPVYPEYVLGLTVPVGLALSYICVSLWKQMSGKILVMLFLSFTLYEVGALIMAPYHQDMTAGSYHNQKQVVDWVLQDSKGEKFGYFVYTPDTYTYGMDYLFWWESKQQRSVQPVSQKLPVTYLILYPKPTDDNGAYAFWEKTKLRTHATVVTTKKFTGGITVEKVSVKSGESDVDPTYYQNLIFR